MVPRTIALGLGAAALLAALSPGVPAGPPQDAAAGGWPELRVGRPLPDLRLPTLGGGTLSLAALRGRKLLLVEFASW